MDESKIKDRTQELLRPILYEIGENLYIMSQSPNDFTVQYSSFLQYYTNLKELTNIAKELATIEETKNESLEEYIKVRDHFDYIGCSLKSQVLELLKTRKVKDLKQKYTQAYSM